jgi:UDP-glucose 4-epimerase
LTGDPLVERDFIWVNDVAFLSEEIIKKNIVGIFNIATGRSITILNIARLVAKSVGPKVEILRQSNKKDDNRAFRLHFDITKLKVVFTTTEMTSLEDGLSQYLIDFK